MRAITKAAVKAFFEGRPWSKDNTQVAVGNDGGVTMYLHGNPIARRIRKRVDICDGGFQSNTTKERLNGVLGALEPRYKKHVSQMDFEWYLGDTKWDGEWTVVRPGSALARLGTEPFERAGVSPDAL